MLRQSLTPHLQIEEEPKPAVIPNPENLFKTDDTSKAFEKPVFLHPKLPAIPHSPKISPSSIPNPNPSVSTHKPAEPGYPNYGGYLYSIPGYSAFQPVSFSSAVQPNQQPGPVQVEPARPDFMHFSPNTTKESIEEEKLVIDDEIIPDLPKPQDFEEHFTPEIVPAAPNTEAHSKTQIESKMSITSLTQGSGATVTIPNQINKDVKKKPERFSLKTSIPISKIDMKSVNNSVDTVFQNTIKKPVFNSVYQKESVERPKVEIQSNIVIKTAHKELDEKEKSTPTTQNNSISTLLNAAEAISKKDNQFRVPEPKADVSTETKKSASPSPQPAVIQRPMYNPINLEKQNFPLKPPEGGYNEQKNQSIYMQNKSVTSPKTAVTVQNSQNPQVLLQRTNFDSKNLQAPSRLSNQNKKTKEEMIAENGTSSKVVALKRLHQDNCDENDFENLITENQIYGNKIVVKEKSQGTQQEQDLKIKSSKDKQTQPETKNVVLQPSYVYVSNVQFPANLMMIKNNSKTCQTTDSFKVKVSPNENQTTEVTTTITNNNNNDSNATIKNGKAQNAVNKEIHVLKSSNNILQSLKKINNKKTETTTNQKVIVNPQVTPVITDCDNVNQPIKEVSKATKKELPKLIEIKANDKSVIIACQYKVDLTLQPKLVIANLKPKVTSKVELLSTLDMYARRKRLRRLKYLSNNVIKDALKVDFRKNMDKIVVPCTKNIITPDKMNAEIFKEFTSTKDKSNAVDNDSGSDYGEDELFEYNSIIEEYGPSNKNDKVEFLAGLRLATHDAYIEKDLEKQDRNLKYDSVATAYIAAGILDRLIDEKLNRPPENWVYPTPLAKESDRVLRSKQKFLSQLRLKQVSQQYKEAYEKTWQAVIKDRKRRYGITDASNNLNKPSTDNFDPNSQLQLLTEIKNCVNINNNLIKKRLDPSDVDSSDIRVLAEKNFSELNRLSKIADRSVKLFSRQDTGKRDLNPGFDSENIQKVTYKIEPYIKNYPKLIIPSISKIVSLKSAEESSAVTSTPATSMDEPESSAACVETQHIAGLQTTDFGCQAGDSFPWPGIDALIKNYREYEIARKKEINDLHRRNTSLCVESAHVTRSASRDSDRARALLAERQHLSVEENNLRLSIKKLCAAVEVIRNS